jgi:hypothetical protein
MPGRTRLIVEKLLPPPPPGVVLVFDVDVPSDEPREYRLNLNDKRDKNALLTLMIMYDRDLVVVSEGGGWVRVRVRNHS